MVKKKTKSKRLTLKDQHKIKKRVTQHHRKQRKEAKKAVRDGIIITKRKNKDVGLPNLMPFKEKFLEQIRDQRALELKIQNEKMFAKRDLALAKSKGNVMEVEEEKKEEEMVVEEEEDKDKKNKDDLEKLQEITMKRQKEFERTNDEEPDSDDATGNKKSNSKRRYMKELMKVLEQSDVLLLVLDAREPLSCRSDLVEDLAIKANKKVIFVLNKIDLIPKDVAEAWLNYLKQIHPTVAFKASTQHQQSNLSRAKTDSIFLASDSENNMKNVGNGVCVGAETLLQLLKNYSRTDDAKSKLKVSLTVGIVGYPNVGKSSLINSLARQKSAAVSSVAGFTKSLQYVQLDSKLKLIDSPGVIFDQNIDKAQKESEIGLVRACVNLNLNYDDKDKDKFDPVFLMEKLVNNENVDKDSLLIMYKIRKFQNADEFLRLVAEKRGKLKKGGVPDKSAAAKIILQDFNTGKIKYFTTPPADISL